MFDLGGLDVGKVKPWRRLCAGGEGGRCVGLRGRRPVLVCHSSLAATGGREGPAPAAWPRGPKRVPSTSGPGTTTREWICGLGGGGGMGDGLGEEEEPAESETLDAIRRRRWWASAPERRPTRSGGRRGRSGRRRSGGGRGAQGEALRACLGAQSFHCINIHNTKSISFVSI